MIKDTSAGSDYSLLILENNTVTVGGYIEDLNDYAGHFGVEDFAEGANPPQPVTKVKNGLGVTVPAPEFKSVVAGVESPGDLSGRMHSIFIDTEGNIYAAGYNNKGQLCLGDKEDGNNIPTQIVLPNDETAISAAVGAEFTLIVTTTGIVYGCGSNEFGQLGLPEFFGDQDSPVEIPELSNVISISAGLDFSLIRTVEGLFAMGNNALGQLCLDPGIGAKATLEQISDDSVLSFAAGWQSSYVLSEDGIRSCGLNSDGQLGDGTLDDSFDASVNLDDIESDIINVYAGPSARSAFFEAADGKVYGTGLNDRGQLGVGDTSNSNVPVEVRFRSDQAGSDISASDTHTLAAMPFSVTSPLGRRVV